MLQVMFDALLSLMHNDWLEQAATCAHEMAQPSGGRSGNVHAAQAASAE